MKVQATIRIQSEFGLDEFDSGDINIEFLPSFAEEVMEDFKFMAEERKLDSSRETENN